MDQLHTLLPDEFATYTCHLTLFMTFRLVSHASERPNILFLLIDDQRYDHLSMLDHPFIQTPHIDKLAKNGVVHIINDVILPVEVPCSKGSND